MIGGCLVCKSEPAPAELIVIDNLETDYLAFEKARELIDASLGDHVLIPVKVGRNGRDPNLVSRRFIEVMCEVAGLESAEIFTVTHFEPISLNVAEQVRKRFEKRPVNSIGVVSPMFRSKRTNLIYEEVFNPLGVKIHCIPTTNPSINTDNWWKTFHGIQEVVLQFLKLQYYRILLL
jgi:hypothetical protein